MPIVTFSTPSGAVVNRVTVGFAKALYRTHQNNVQNMMLFLKPDSGCLLVEFKEDPALEARFRTNCVIRRAWDDIFEMVRRWMRKKSARLYVTEDYTFVQERHSQCPVLFWDAEAFLLLRVSQSWEQFALRRAGPFRRMFRQELLV